MSSIRKMFAIVVLASAAVAGCHNKKPAPTPPVEKTPETGATGGASYGGHKPDAPPSAIKDEPKSDK
jgi:predicted small lipoprotein YifL